MLNKIDFKKQISIALVFFVMTLSLFSIGIFAFLQHPFDWSIFINYSIVSLVVSAYLFLIMHKKYNFAFLLFIIGYILAFAFYLYNATKEYTGFLEIAGILSWFVIMVLVIALGLTFEFLLKSKHENRTLHKLAKEKELQEQEIQTQSDDPEFQIETSHEETVEDEIKR